MPGSGFTGEKCGALTRQGTACLQPAMRNGRCRMHGGKTPRGAELPQFSHGRYSKAIPDRLSMRYEEALSDAERHDLRDEIALSEAKIDDLLAGMGRGESDSILLLMRDKERQMRAAEARGDSERAGRRLREILTLIRCGGDESLAWKDVDGWIARKTRTVEADARIAATKQQMISVEEMMALIGLILSAIRRHVPDQSVRNALAQEIRAAAELEDRNDAVISLPPLPSSTSDTERDGDS
jgi:hypothetical protein